MNFPGINLNSPEECQTALELNERFIHRYTELLDRFGNLPACDALIYEQLKGEFPAEFLESLPSFTFLPPPGDPTAPNANASEPADSEDMEPSGEMDEPPNIPDEELPPQLRMMRQTEQHILLVQNSVYQLMCDWSNLYSAILPPNRRKEGLQVLMLSSLMLGNMRSCLDQMGCFQFGMALQLSFRGHQLCEELFKLIQKLDHELPNLSTLLSSRTKLLEDNLRSFEEIHRLLKSMPEEASGDF